MKVRTVCSTLISLILGLGMLQVAQAEEIHGLASIALQGTSDIVRDYERKTGNKVIIEWLPAVEITQRLKAGATPDFVFNPSKSVDDFIQSGVLLSDGRLEIVQSGIGIGVPRGTPKRTIATMEDLKQALLSAKSIVYATGPSGDHIESLIKQMGIGEQIKGKIKISTGFVGKDIEKGMGDIGFQQIPEIMLVPGIDLLGPLPPDCQKMTPFSIAVVASSKHAKTSKEFFKFLKNPALSPEYKKHGLDPL